MNYRRKIIGSSVKDNLFISNKSTCLEPELDPELRCSKSVEKLNTFRSE